MSLSDLADDASRLPAFFGHGIARFMIGYGLTLELLSSEWHVSMEVMHQIRLCRVPQDADQCQQIASRFGVSVEKIREVLGF